MRRLTPSSIRRWAKVNGRKFPAAISIRCPHCDQVGVFTLGKHLDDPKRGAMSASGHCPACQHHIGVWGVNEGGEECADVYFHPDNYDYHELLREGVELPEPLMRAYSSTVDAYNSGNFPATAVCCRRTLEGIFKYLLPEEERNVSLANAIESATARVDLAKPVKELSGVLRKGGNLGAHFDLQKEPDEHLAKAMVDLLEYLISYLYVLPKKIAEAEDVLAKDA